MEATKCGYCDKLSVAWTTWPTIGRPKGAPMCQEHLDERNIKNNFGEYDLVIQYHETPDVDAIIHACHDSYRLGAEVCSYDDGKNNPAWLKPGDQYWYWDLPGGVLEMGGLRIPLTSRWILCPKHAHLARDAA